MGTIFGISALALATFVGGYVVHMFVPLSRLWEWGKWALAKIGVAR